MAAGSAGEGAGSNTELRWRRFQDYIACQSGEMALARGITSENEGRGRRAAAAR